jgi:RimJ/RimL family protein N-acetyltransferase
LSLEEPCLRRANDTDVDRLHDLFCVFEVYRYLADGAAPPRHVAAHWIDQGLTEAASGLGLWLLEDPDGTLSGCVRLERRPASRTAELTFVLHPRVWGRGLATRASWTVVQQAFRAGAVDEIVAGADEPNVASVAVMRRLGMRFERAVSYPAGPGVEYVLTPHDPPPHSIPEPVTMCPRT